MKRFSLLLAVFALAVFTLSSCKSGPDGVAKKWLTAFYHKDYATAKTLSTPETQEQLDAQAANSDNTGTARDSAQKLTVTIKSTKQLNDTAAQVIYTVSNEPTQERKLKLVKVDNKWLVSWSKLDEFSDFLMPNGGNGGAMPNTPDPGLLPAEPMDTASMPVAPPADASIDTSNGNMMR